MQIAAADPSGEEFAELAPMLVETNERNITIVKALLDLAAADHAPFDPEPVDLAALATDAAAERTAQAATADLRLNVDTEPDCTVPGNTTPLRQLLLNLLDNALAYNKPGGSVHLAVLREKEIVIEVENTGRHIDEIVAQRLFEPFYRQQSRVTSDRSWPRPGPRHRPLDRARPPWHRHRARQPRRRPDRTRQAAAGPEVTTCPVPRP